MNYCGCLKAIQLEAELLSEEQLVLVLNIMSVMNTRGVENEKLTAVLQNLITERSDEILKSHGIPLTPEFSGILV